MNDANLNAPPQQMTKGLKLASQLNGTLERMARSGDMAYMEKAAFLAKALAILAFMTDEEFEAISERATKGWLE